jgi:hypothetical protein
MNIFNIDDPTMYACRIHFYTEDSPILMLDVSKNKLRPGGGYWLVFAGVIYMQCPIWWVGADFSVAGSEEYWLLIEEIYLRPQGWAAGADPLVDEFLVATKEKAQYEPYRLYKAETITGAPIRIIARDAWKTDEAPRGHLDTDTRTDTVIVPTKQI